MSVLSVFVILFILAVLPFAVVSWRDHRLVIAGYYLTIITRIVLAAGHSLEWWQLPDSHADTMRFFNKAEKLAEAGTLHPHWYSVWAYENILSLVFRVTGSYYFIGCLTSILAFALFLIVVYRLIQNLMTFTDKAANASFLLGLFVFSFLPSTLTYTTLVFREGWMMLFVAVTVYGMHSVIFKKRYLSLVTLFTGLIGGMFVHKALVLYALKAPYVLFSPLFTKAPDRQAWIGSFLRRGGLVLVTFAVVWGGSTGLQALNSNIRFPYMQTAIEKGVFDEGGLAEKAEIYQKRQTVSRTHYGIDFQTSSFKNLIMTGIPQAFSYMFRPLPHEVNNIFDAYAFMEGLMRFMLVISTVLGWLYMNPLQKSTMLYLTLHYTLISLFWAAGTSAWGTAIRHHTSNNWILIITGFYGLYVLYRRWQAKKNLT